MSAHFRKNLALIGVLASVVFAFFFVYSLVGKTGEALVYERPKSVDATIAEPKPKPPPPPVHIKTPEEVHAVYMTSWVAGSPQYRDNIINFISSSNINGIVVDIKDYTGKVSFVTNDEEIHAWKSEEKRIADIRGLIDNLHRKNLYVIGRVSVFQDPFISKTHPELAVLNTKGAVWKDRKGLSFIDPGATKYWDYIVRIARESERAGFDEINFDYIRFPSDGKLSEAVFPYAKTTAKAVVMENFFTYLRRELIDLPVPISADLFGLATYSEDDLGIGQVLERTAPHFDFISPMIYPSHYASGFQGFKNPAEHPYEVVLVSMERAVARLKAMGQDIQKLRPWIQDFDLGAPYGVTEVLAQINALKKAGLSSWMAWDPSNVYTKAAYAQ